MADGNLGVNQVVIMLDGSKVIHVVCAVSLTGKFPAAQFVVPGLPLVRTVHSKRIGGQEGGDRYLSRPIYVETVHGIKNAGLDGIEHFECSDDGTGRKSFEYNLAFRCRRDFLTKLLELDVAQGSGIPCSLHFKFNGICSRYAHHGRKTESARRSAGHSRCFDETPAGDLFFLRFACFNVLSHKLPPLLGKKD